MTVFLSFLFFLYALMNQLTITFLLTKGYDTIVYDSSAQLPNINNSSIQIFSWEYSNTTLIVCSLLFILISIYFSCVLNKLRKKTDAAESPLLWTPLLNIAYLYYLADLSPWLLLFLLIPILGTLITIILIAISTIKLLKKLNISTFLAIVSCLPGIDLISFGILAFR